MGVKMKLRIITKNQEADQEIRFLQKSILKLSGRATATPPAWELKNIFFLIWRAIGYRQLQFQLVISDRDLIFTLLSSFSKILGSLKN